LLISSSILEKSPCINDLRSMKNNLAGYRWPTEQPTAPKTAAIRTALSEENRLAIFRLRSLKVFVRRLPCHEPFCERMSFEMALSCPFQSRRGGEAWVQDFPLTVPPAFVEMPMNEIAFLVAEVHAR
jgi:hypothetical protein